MKDLRGLRSRLLRLIARALTRRFLAWLSCAVILFSLGTAVAATLRIGAQAQVGILLIAFSALPVFLLWPLPMDLLERGLRRTDEGSVFESLLEAPPGPSRELLRAEARRKDAGLATRPSERARLPKSLAILLAISAATFLAVQALSLARRGQLLLAYPRESELGAQARAEEGGFEGLPIEGAADPESERSALSEGERSGAEGLAEEAGSGSAAGSPGARRRRSSEEDMASIEADMAVTREGGLPEPDGAMAETGAPGDRVGSAAPGGEGGARGDGESGAGRRGRGYSASGSSSVSSPLIDYRARFSRAYAQKTGKRFAASGNLGLGELGEIERRFFRSFSLEVDVAPSEDGFDAQIKRRWRELRGGFD